MSKLIEEEARETYRRYVETRDAIDRGELPWTALGLCTTEDKDQVRTFFAAPGRAPIGTARNVALVTEYIERCIRLRARITGPLKAYLSTRH